jgi:hypothetical protein
MHDSVNGLAIRPSKGDYLVFVLALLIVFGSFGYFWQSGMRAVQAEIRVNGKFRQHVDLFQAQTLQIQGKLGLSIITIEKGRVRFSDSPCTSKQCIHQGWLSHGGEIATCLPNEVSVHIAGPDPLYDSINF